MTRIGMHFSLWAASWTKQAAEAAIPEAARYGLQVVEIPLLVPESIDVAHARDLLAAHGIAPAASLCLPPDRLATSDPAAARDFLLAAVEVAHALGCSFLGGVTYSALGYTSGAPPTEAEYDAIADGAAAGGAAGARTRPDARPGTLQPLRDAPAQHRGTDAGAAGSHRRAEHGRASRHLPHEHRGEGHRRGFPRRRRARPYIHLSESDRGVPGTGTIDWEEAFAALAEIGFSGDLVIESFVTLPPEIAAALCVWRPVARDRYEVLDAGVSYLRRLALKHRLIA